MSVVLGPTVAAKATMGHGERGFDVHFNSYATPKLIFAEYNIRRWLQDCDNCESLVHELVERIWYSLTGYILHIYG